MENENIVPGTKDQPTPSTSPVNPATPPTQANTLLLVAAVAILIGFFLPWINSGGGRGSYSDFVEGDNGMPVINGINLLSLAGEVEAVGWLFTLFLLLIPVGSIIVAYNSYQRVFSEKTMMFGIASAAFLPISIFTLYLIVPSYASLWEDEGSSIFKPGVGLIIMLLGSVYCFIYAMGKLSRNMKNVLPGPMFKFGAIGGVIAALLLYLIFRNINGGDESPVYIYLGIFIFSLLLSVYLYRTNAAGSNYHSSIVTGFIFSGIYILTLLIIASTGKRIGMNMISQAFIPLLVIHCLFGFIISSLGANTGTGITRPVEEPAARMEDPVLASNEVAVAVPVQPKVVASPFDWGAYYRKNKKFILVLIVFLVGGITTWMLLKPNPERDGRRAAKAECNCKMSNDKATTKAYDDFMGSFDSAHFKSRSEARSKLQGMISALETENLQCNATAKEKYYKLAGKFKDHKKTAKFSLAYYKGISSCPNTTDRAALNNKFEEKLRTIKEPEPDIEKIKLDLINQSVPGWTFRYLSEIKQASVANTTRTDERIEYTVDLKLENYSTSEQSDAQVIIAYNQGDDGWYLSNMNAVFITFVNVASVGEWKTVYPLSNCSYTIISEGNKFWIQDGAYGTKYKAGGDDGEVFQLTGTQLYIMSREDKDVNLIFKYTPNSQ